MTSSSSSIIWPECKPYGTDDLSNNLLPSEYVKAKQQQSSPEKQDQSAWGEFKSTLKNQGVPFNVIKDVPTRDREDLACAIFPWSASRQREVLTKWPKRRASYSGTVAERQIEAEERGRRRSYSKASSKEEIPKSRQPKKTAPSGRPFIVFKKTTSPIESPLRSAPWQQPAVARAKAAARAAARRSKTTSHLTARHLDMTSNSSHKSGSKSSSRASSLSSRSDSRGRLADRSPSTARAPARSPSPAKLLFPVGTVVQATKLGKSYPELNGVKGKVLGPAENNYIPVCFPAPFDEVVLHYTKLKPYTGQASDIAPRKSCLTRGTFHDFRWLHPSDPPPPPITIISYATSPPSNGGPSKEQGVVRALEQQVENAEAEFGENDTSTLLAVWRLAILLCLEHRPAEALPHARRAVSGLKDKGDGDNYVGAKCTLAAALHDSGLPDDAVQVFKPQVENVEGELVNESNDDYLLLVQMHNLAVLYQRQGNNVAAEPYARKVLQGLAVQYGRYHTFTTAAMANLAIVLHSRKMCLEAAVLADRARLELRSLDNSPTRLIKMRLDEIAACVPQAELDSAVMVERDLEEAVGALWSKTVLVGIGGGHTPAGVARMVKFKGRTLYCVNGRVVTRHSEITAMCENSVFIVFCFAPRTEPDPATPHTPTTVSPKSPTLLPFSSPHRINLSSSLRSSTLRDTLRSEKSTTLKDTTVRSSSFRGSVKSGGSPKTPLQKPRSPLQQKPKAKRAPTKKP